MSKLNQLPPITNPTLTDTLVIGDLAAQATVQSVLGLAVPAGTTLEVLIPSGTLGVAATLVLGADFAVTSGTLNVVGGGGGGGSAGVASFDGNTGAVTLTSAEVTTALGFSPVQAVNGRNGNVVIGAADIQSALGYTPANVAGIPAGTTLQLLGASGTQGTATTIVVGQNLVYSNGTLNAEFAGGTAGVASFDGRIGAVTLGSADVTGALGYSPVVSVNGHVGAVVLSGTDIVASLSYTPANKAGDTFTGGVTLSAGGNVSAGTFTIGSVASLNVLGSVTLGGAVSETGTDINSGTFEGTGTVQVPTVAQGDNSFNAASTAFMQRALSIPTAIAVTGGSYGVTPAQAQAPTLIVTGTLTGPQTLTVPNNGAWAVANRTTGPYPLLVATAAGTGVYVPQGATLRLLADGTNVVSVGGLNASQWTPIGASPAGPPLVPLFRGGGPLSQGFSLSTDIAGGTVRLHTFASQQMSGIRALFQNYDTSNIYESDAANPITITAAWDDGVNPPYKLTFNGEPSFLLGQRGDIWCDFLPLIIPAAASFMGYVAGNVLTVTQMISGTIVLSSVLRGAGMSPEIPIALTGGAYGTGSGGTGTYTLGGTIGNLGSSGNPVLFYASAPNYIKVCVKLAMPPINASVLGSSTGGSLAAGTHYWKITALCGRQGESGGSVELTYTASGTTSSAQLLWQVDPRSVAPTAFLIYHSMSTGTECFLVNVGMPPVNASGYYSWTDQGLIAYGVSAQATAAAMTASTTMTLTGVALGTIAVGQYVFGTGVTAGAKVSALGTSTGSNGTITLSAAQTIASETVYFANPVPANQKFPIGSAIYSGAYPGELSNYVSLGGAANTGVDATSIQGVAWGAGTFTTGYGPSLVAGLPSVLSGKPYVMLVFGDSIADGQTSSGQNTNNQGPQVLACMSLNVPVILGAKGGEYLANLAQANNPAYARNKLQLLDLASHVYIQAGTNDVYNGYTDAQVSADLLKLATIAAGRGCKVIVPTILPRNTTTDSGVTLANQTWSGPLSTFAGSINGTTLNVPSGTTIAVGMAIGAPATAATPVLPGTLVVSGSGTSWQVNNSQIVPSQTLWASNYEGVRQTQNIKRRNGFPCLYVNGVLTSVPVGTAGAIVAGQAGHPISVFVDEAGQVEVNASNVLTPNGGFWGVFPLGSVPSPSGQAMSVDNIHPTCYLGGTFTGSISGNTLTVTAGANPYIGSTLSGNGITGSPSVLSGSAGTYTISGSAQSIPSGVITHTPLGNTQVLIAQAIINAAPLVFA